MNFNGIFCHCGRSVHISRQNFQFDFYQFCCGIRLFLGIRTDNRDRVSDLENFFIAKDRTIPSVSFIGREGDQAGNLVSTFDVFRCYNFENAFRFFSFGSVNRDNIRMRYL